MCSEPDIVGGAPPVLMTYVVLEFDPFSLEGLINVSNFSEDFHFDGWYW